MSADLLRRAAALMRERAQAASAGPWSYNGYSRVFSGPLVVAEEAFWTEERLDDPHTYDHRVGEVCPGCGDRPAVHPETGERFGTMWDCALASQAYTADSCVAFVPAAYGDTARGRHAADAVLIASWHPDVVLVIADWLDRIADGYGLELTYHADEAAAEHLARVYLANLS